MSLNPDWLDEKGSSEYCELLKVVRESGDGESKETSPHTSSASEDDNNEIAQSLIDVTRKLERKKDKKASKIPIRQGKVSHNADVTKSTCGNKFYYEQSDYSEIAKAFHKISDKSLKGKIEIDSAVDTFENCAAEGETAQDYKEGLSISVISNFVDSDEADVEREMNGDFTNVRKIGSAEVFELKQANLRMGDEYVTVNNGLETDDPILEAPEEFRSFFESNNFVSSESEYDMKVNEMFPMPCTDIGEAKPCRIVAAVRDHDIVTEPEVDDMCGLDLNNDIIKISEREIRADNELDQICMTNDARKYKASEVEETVDANVSIKYGAPSDITEIMHGVGYCQHALTDINDGGESEDNDQIQSDSISISEFDTESHFNGIDGGNNSTSMVGVLSEYSQLQITVKDDGEKLLPPKNTITETLNNISSLCNVRDSVHDSKCPEGRDSMNELDSLDNGTYACAENEQTPTAAVKPSIAIGVERCAQAPRCSRISVATVCAASTLESPILRDLTEICSHSNNVVTEKHTTESLYTNKLELNNETTTDNDKKLNRAKKSESASDICAEKQDAHLIWTFKNGRLVFETSPIVETEREANTDDNPSATELLKCQSKPPRDSNNENEQQSNNDESKSLLSSRDLNRRAAEGRSRLKHLENKLKEAGLTDGQSNIFPNVESKLDDDEEEKIVNFEKEKELKQVVDKLTQPLLKLNCDTNENDNSLGSESSEDLLPENNGSGDFACGGSLCEFDVRQVGSFSGLADSDFFVVYDELESSGDEDEREQHYNLISEMRGDGSMGADGERGKQHNPDHENLKSLLKKPGKGRDVKKNRVVFNENKNEFFDADYIILIREECDYDDEEDDGVCTCNDHEMVRLTCCEPNCNCNLYEGYSSDPTPQSPKFAPPLEFVDAVTLSPPEGYKDMELGEQQLLALQQMAMRGQRTAVCRDCSATHDDDGEGSQSDNEDQCELHSDQEENKEGAEKTDQSQQTTPTTPPPPENDNTNQQYIVETVRMTTVTERQITREIEDDKQRSNSPNLSQIGSPISGILKGGRLWKQQSQEINNMKNIEQQRASDSGITSDEENNGNKRSVRFTESNENQRDVCDGAADQLPEEIIKQEESSIQKDIPLPNSSSPESTEMMLTFKLGNHILISNNSLKPNSAVRQLFPCSKPLSNKPGDNDSVHQYLVTAESLRAFEEAKRSKLPQIIQSDDTDDSIKRAIERNTLRRSLIRYEPRPKKKEQKTDNSLVERIKQLTCDVDDVIPESEDIQQRASPPGEEARKSPEVNPVNKSFSPSSSSTASSNSSTVSSTYKKITDLFGKREKQPDIQNNQLESNSNIKSINQLGPAPDLGNTSSHPQDYIMHHCPVTKSNSTTDTRKQFLSTLAPLTACVTSLGVDDHYYHISHHTGDRSSVTSSVGTEYSLEDIDDGLKNEEDDTKRNAPDVVVGTPSASESGDELAMFVQQDASRIERIKKKYQQDSEDDEHDDYGFNKRPSVRGIKPRFGTTTEILQQIQNQMQPVQAVNKVNPHVAWPYYSEASLSGLDNNKSRNINQNIPQYQYTYVTEEMKTKMYIQHYRPTSLVDDNVYQNCTNQRCNRDVAYKTNANIVHSPVMRIGGGCSELYHPPPLSSKSRNGRPESPPPFDVARNVHQTMVYIPYNHIESYQPACMSPNPQYIGNEKGYTRIVNQNQINRYAEPVYHSQPRITHAPLVDVNLVKQMPKPVMRLPYPLPNTQPQAHLISSRSESPLPGQFSTARSTQTTAPPMGTCNYYQTVTPRYRPMVGPIISHGTVPWNGDNIYANKLNRHSFPAAMPRYPAPDNISLTDSESQYSGPLPNGFRQSIETTFSAQKDSLPNSPTKPKFIERGVPEGAASVSPQDSNSGQNNSTMTSPTSPQNPPSTNSKPLFYAMNV
ncbi:hypothetical protein RI129_005402 [Pyrocoelia pectoralis]|uniref:Uncharacterized protein n=1 Tax=Pyrocoelia pectoralis TaxID=417401 RepID=A0AAN7VKQ5_9COLE